MEVYEQWARYTQTIVRQFRRHLRIPSSASKIYLVILGKKALFSSLPEDQNKNNASEQFRALFPDLSKFFM